MVVVVPPVLSAQALAETRSRVGPRTEGDTGSLAASPLSLIVNPRSHRAFDKAAVQAIALATARGAEIVRIDSPAALSAHVRSLLSRRQRRVVVLAGDGTVHAIVDQLARLPIGAFKPELLLLPGGRSNLTANDLARGGAPLALLRTLLAADRADGEAELQIVERATLRVEQSPAPPRHGFFVAAALVDQVIRRVHDDRGRRGFVLRRGELGTAATLLRLAALTAIGRPAVRAPTLRVDAGTLGRQHEPIRFLLATTLAHDRGAFDPYPPRGSGDLRIASVARRAPRLVASLPRLLTGRWSPAMSAASGWLGGRCHRLEVTGLAGYTIDGEHYDADPARPIVVTPGPRLRFIAEL